MITTRAPDGANKAGKISIFFSIGKKPHQHLVSCRSAPSQVFFRQKTVVLPIPGFDLRNTQCRYKAITPILKCFLQKDCEKVHRKLLDCIGEYLLRMEIF